MLTPAWRRRRLCLRRQRSGVDDGGNRGAHIGVFDGGSAAACGVFKDPKQAQGGGEAHPGLAPEAAERGGVDGGDGAVDIGVVDGGHRVARRAADQVGLDRADAAHILHVAILARLQRHVLGAHLQQP